MITQTKAFETASAAYSPEVIEIMSTALAAAIENLPEPVSATHVHQLAESILCNAAISQRWCASRSSS
jgi:hypothetical protein